MQKSESVKELAAALAAAQAEMPAAELNARNPFLKNKYADLGSIISTVKPVLAKHGLSVSQLPVTTDGHANVIATFGEEQPIISYGQIGITTILMHTSGEWLESTITLPVVTEKGKSIAQVGGSIITYLRRYSLAAILGMYAEEDSDGNAPSVQKRKPKPDPVAEAAKAMGGEVANEPAMKQWQDFLEGVALTHTQAVELLGTKTVNEWIKAEEGRNLEMAMQAVRDAIPDANTPA